MMEKKPKQDQDDKIVEFSKPTQSFFSDLNGLRLSVDEVDTIGSKEILTRVPVRRPQRGEYVRVNPNPEMSIVVTIYTDKDDRDEVFFVAPSMRGVLAEDLKAVLLVTAISRRGTLFIWPLQIPSEENPIGRSWHESARKAAEIAKGTWVRIIADKSLGGYRARAAEGKLADPVWPEVTFNELLEIAFQDRIIQSGDHPVVRRLRGLT